LRNFRTIIINLCGKSFPKEWIKENRTVCRVYVDQVMRPLFDVERTEKSASMMFRVDRFHRKDGKINDSERLSLQEVEIIAEILGDDHPSTLMTCED
jgi:hypothetical protein